MYYTNKYAIINLFVRYSLVILAAGMMLPPMLPIAHSSFTLSICYASSCATNLVILAAQLNTGMLPPPVLPIARSRAGWGSYNPSSSN